jgi:hypothetical protein
MKKLTALFLLTTFFVVASCGGDDKGTTKYTDAADCSKVPANNNYNTSIKPILASSCAFDGCHSTKTASDGVILDTYAGAKKSFVNGTSLCAINRDGCSPMPKGSDKLSGEILNILACWVKNGTPE